MSCSIVVAAAQAIVPHEALNNTLCVYFLFSHMNGFLYCCNHYNVLHIINYIFTKRNDTSGAGAIVGGGRNLQFVIIKKHYNTT